MTLKSSSCSQWLLMTTVSLTSIQTVNPILPFIANKDCSSQFLKRELETNKALILEWLSFIVALHFLLLWTFTDISMEFFVCNNLPRRRRRRWFYENYKWKVFFQWVVRKSLSSTSLTEGTNGWELSLLSLLLLHHFSPQNL